MISKENQKIQVSELLVNQIPDFIKEENPQFLEFLKRYFLSKEYQGGDFDLIRNILSYKTNDVLFNLVKSTTLTSSVNFYDETINVSSTHGWPDTYGLLKIGEEIITYESKTRTSFLKCKRGFSGVDSLGKYTFRDKLQFKETSASNHVNAATVTNLSILFLEEFLSYTKSQFLPGFENVSFYTDVNESLISSRIRDFYSTKGTEYSFDILFKILYGEEATVFSPKTYAIKPSYSNYREVDELIVEVVSGDVNKLKGQSIYQDRGSVTETAEGVVFDVNFIRQNLYPERVINVSYTKSDNIITVTSNFHGIKTGGSVYLQVSTGDLESRVFTNIQRVDDNTFLILDSVSGTTSGTATITTINEEFKYFYSLKLSSSDGQFNFSGKTKLLESISPTQESIVVDSTLGFPESGTLLINQEVFSYTSKSSNEFLGCSPRNNTYDIGDSLSSNATVYGYEDGNLDKRVSLRILDILTNTLSDESVILKEDTSIGIKDIGYDEKTSFTESLFYNLPVDINVSSIDYDVNTISFEIPHELKRGEKINIKDKYQRNRFGIRSKNLNSSPLEILNTNPQQPNILEVNLSEINRSIKAEDLVASKVLQRGNTDSATFSEIGKELANIQKTFIDVDKKNYYLCASSIPDYIVDLHNTSSLLKKSGSLTDIDSNHRITIPNHELFSGENVFFGIRTGITDSSQGTYVYSGSFYAKKISEDVINLALSRSSIESNDFIKLNTIIADLSLSGSTIIEIQKYEVYNKKPKNQKLLKRIKIDKNQGEYYDFDKKPYHALGILNNGVELYPPFEDETITYGRIDSVNVLNGGQGFDLLNPPEGYFGNTVVGTGASVFFGLEGQLEEILVSNSGKNVNGDIKVKVSGGNNENVQLNVVLANEFTEKTFSPVSDVSLLNDTITFPTNHNFVNGEPVEYTVIGVGNTAIGLSDGSNLVNNSVYYVNVFNSTTVRLSNSKEDALAGTVINFGTEFGSGDHKIVSVNPKKTLESVQILNPGKFYTKSIILNSPRVYPKNNNYEFVQYGVNLNSDYIFYRDHSFKEGELIKYEASNSVIGGLQDNSYYHVILIDKDSFRLTYAGANLENISKSNYNNKKYILLSSTPATGSHTFKYPDISITIDNDKSDVSPQIESVIRGSISDVIMSTNGKKYGSKVINFEKEPTLNIYRGTGGFIALLTSGGKIVEAYITISGKNYYSEPELILKSKNGKFGKLKAEISNGKISNVKIINPGIDYDDTTEVIIRDTSSDERFRVNVQTWRVNSVVKNILTQNNISDVSGVLNEHSLVSGNSDSSQIISMYVPKLLRSRYGDVENGTDADIVNKTFAHSKIMGWAYDGNPIYAQFGYSNPNSTISGTKRLRSGYNQVPTAKLNTDDNRPGDISEFSAGFFIEDYYFDNSGDLDEYNGRYCITPEYPNGTYAYFSVLDVNGRPDFPYCIYGLAERYDTFNQDFIKTKQSYLNKISSDLISVTYYNRLFDDNAEYSFLDKNYTDFRLNVNEVPGSFVEELTVLNAGDDYKVKDQITVNNPEDFGVDAKGSVTSLKGKTVSSVVTTVNQKNKIYFQINPDSVTGISSQPHELSSRANIRVSITGITTNNFTFLNGAYPINLLPSSTKIIESVPNAGVTTHLKFSEGVTSLVIDVDDVIKIGDEKMKILNVDFESNTVKVNRAHDSTTRVAHSTDDEVSLLKSRFSFNTGIKTEVYTENYTKSYFAKSQVGIGSITRTTSYVGIKTEIKIDSKKIYIPNHNFENNQKVKYEYSVGTGLTASTSIDLTPTFTLTNNQSLFVVKYDNNFIGLSTTRVSVGNSNPGLYFVDVSDEDQYDQSLTFNTLPQGNIREFETVVSTSSTHGLLLGDVVSLSVNPSFTNNFTLSYDNNLESLLLASQTIDPNAGISSLTNTVTIVDHGLETGDIVRYENVISGSLLSSDFVSGNLYYVKVFSPDLFAFAETELNAINGKLVNIGITTSTHRIRKVNPTLRCVKGSKIKIDISNLNSGEGNSEINFYQDRELKIKYDSSSFVNNENDITIDTNTIPNELFFTLIRNGSIIGGTNQKQSQIQVFNSFYDDTYTITGVSSTKTFNIELGNVPEVLSYGSTNSSPNYTTSSENAFGPIDNVVITERGDLFKYPTGSVVITSDYGKSGNIKYNLKKVDNVTNKTKISKNTYDFSSDETYTFNLDVPSIVSVKSNKKIVDIKVTDSGNNYNSPPKVIVTDEPNIITSANLFGNSVGSVDLITTNNGILRDSATAFGEFNTNGVEVVNVTKESNNTTINLFIKEPNNGFDTFPFEVGDEIFVEGIVSSENNPGDGYNSKDYDFAYFKVTRVTTTSGSANIRYSIVGLGTTAGTYDSERSYGRVIKKSDLAKFEVVLDSSSYFVGESVYTDSGYRAVVDKDGWNETNSVLSLVKQEGILKTNDILVGSESGTKSIVDKIDNYESKIEKQASLKTFESVNDYISNTNESNQVISDNYYYQPFSYDIRSKVPLNTWKSTVSNLNHISGFEKFGTFVSSGIITDANVKLDEGEVTSIVFIESEGGDFSEYKSFDLVNELSLNTGQFFFSKEIVFNSRQLTDSIESKTNRSILIDDISEEFTGKIDDENGSDIVGLTSFRLTTSETGSKSSLFVKSFDSSDSDVVILEQDKIYIKDHNFSTGEQVDYIPNGTRVSIASTDRVIGGASTTLLPDSVFIINLDQNHIRLCGLSSDASNGIYFDITSVGIGSHKFKSTNQNTRCLLTIDGIIQSPIYKTKLEYTLNEAVGVGSTTITLTGVTSIRSNSILQIGSELLQVGVVGYGGSSYQLSVDRAFMGSVASAHTVGVGVSLVKGEYIIRDDVVYFSDAPFSGINTIFDYSNTGIPTSFVRSRFHGRVMQRLNYDANKIFDDITEFFDGTKNLFELKSNNESTEDIFNSNVGILTGADVNSGVILINNIFQTPNIDYQLIQNVGVGASVEFLGSNSENLPSGGQILEFTEDTGSGYQELERALGIVTGANLLSGAITSVTLTQPGSGYREDTAVTVLANVGSGASIVALVGTGNYPGNTVNVSNFVYDESTGISTVTTSTPHGFEDGGTVRLTGIEFTCAAPHAGVTTTVFPDGTQSFEYYVRKINSTTQFEINVGISTIAHTYDTGGTASPGSNVGFITGFRVDDGGSGYLSSQLPIISVPTPRSYSNLSLTGGSGSGAKMDIVVLGAAGTVFSYKLTDPGIGYKEDDVLSISGIPTSPFVPSSSPFEITITDTFKDKFSGYTFGELLIFDDISSQANGARTKFSLTRTRSGAKELVSLNVPKGSAFKLQNNLLIFINDILQIPGESYEFEGGTQVTFTEPPKTDSKIVILYFKGSDADVVEVDIRETIKTGDIIELDKDVATNSSRELERKVFTILSSDTIETNIYSNVGLTSDTELDRVLNWTKQKNDSIIDGIVISKTRPELVPNFIPNVNIIKDLSSSDTEIFVDTVKEFQLDSQLQINQDLIVIDSKYAYPNQAKATLTIIDGYIDSVSISTGGYGYYSAPEVSLSLPGELDKQIGSTWNESCEEQDSELTTITGITTISEDTQVSSFTVLIQNGATLNIESGVDYVISGFDLDLSELNDVTFDRNSDRYYVAGNDGLVAYSDGNLCEFIRYPFDETTNDPDPVLSIDVVYKTPRNYIVVGGQGFVGFATVGDVLDIQKTAFPLSAGGIEAGTFLDPSKKVSITNQTFNVVKHFPTMNGLIALGSTIMTSKDVTSDNGNLRFGFDWSMSRTNFGGPFGQTINDVEYFPKKEFTNRPSSRGYVAVGNTGYIFKSNDGYKWNTQNTSRSFRVSPSSIPINYRTKNLNSIATDNRSLVAVGDSGAIIRTETLITGSETWSNVGIANTTENLTSITHTGKQYVVVSDIGNVYTSIGGTSWVKQTSITTNQLNSIHFGNYSATKQTLIAVGINTIVKSSLETTEASITASITNGIVTSLTISNPGYGYSSTNPPQIMIAPPNARYERIENVKVEGDFGDVVSISTVTGIGTDWALKFEFDIDSVLNSLLYDQFSLTQSGIKTGYYFALSESVYGDFSSSVSGIDTTNSYADINTSTSFNNIYRADSIVTNGTGTGIVTVTSNINASGIGLVSQELNSSSGISTKLDYVAKYSWGRIFDMVRPESKAFEIFDDYSYLSKNPSIQRILGLKESY